MTIKVRRSKERGATKIDWLDSKHTFSFGEYYDEDFVQFGCLRVINEDIVSPARGFGKHSHRDMEILTYVLSGELEHKDSMGNGSVLQAGSIQRMTAGTGVQHSEWNHSKTEPVHFLQIWVIPESPGLQPSYEEHVAHAVVDNEWQVMASNQEGEGVFVHQDIILSRAHLTGGASLSLNIRQGRMIFIHVIDGSCRVDDLELSAGDAAQIDSSGQVTFSAIGASSLLCFDLVTQN